MLRFKSFLIMLICINCFNPFLAEIFSSRTVHIWTRCKIVGPYNFSYCCSGCSVLHLRCQKIFRWLFWSLGGIHNGSCHCLHNLCESLSLTHTHKHNLFLSLYGVLLYWFIRHFVYKHEKHCSMLQLTHTCLD
jgi:hypothetical protein